MKWILIMLLLVNASLFGYQAWQAQQPEQEVVSSFSVQHGNLALSESQQARLAKSAEATQTSQKSTQSTSAKCVRITGLKESDSLPVVESRLKALELNVKQVRAKELLKREYQVVLGPFNSIDQARSEMIAINAKGFESFVISKGDLANSLSLGLFSTKENAQRRLAELSAVDITARAIEIERFNEAIQLVLDSKSSLLIADPTLASLVNQFEGVDFTRFICN
ncbi:SPOR domain-containing protein [Reinekea marina]|uniref:SPOR domain-containing protein n=1 Tax=Reinekea marina TaxID=1310421 RepID=A0ABV7WUZ2_9GAMM|nr:SPOR domain-containing protein [Reinekea marina]MDN3648005.1 SPOR domain-containing protein [Reinekea marina]